MANRKGTSWYSVTLSLARITDVVPADPVVPAAPSTFDTAVGYTDGPVAEYDWNRGPVRPTQQSDHWKV